MQTQLPQQTMRYKEESQQRSDSTTNKKKAISQKLTTTQPIELKPPTNKNPMINPHSKLPRKPPPTTEPNRNSPQKNLRAKAPKQIHSQPKPNTHLQQFQNLSPPKKNYWFCNYDIELN